MIHLLLDLTLRGTLATLLVLGLDWLLTKRMRPSWRRAWWILVALAWLVPVRLPHFDSLPHWPTFDAARIWNPGTEAPANAPETNPAAIAPAETPRDWAPIAVAMVFAGAVATLLVVAWRTVHTARRWRQERLCTDTELLSLLEDCKATAGVTAPIGLVLTTSVSTPALLGWLRPRILLPQNLVPAISRDELRTILLHELAHFRSIDIPLNWLFSAALALHWFNPVVHLAARRWRHFRELAADASVLGWLPAGTNEVYGGALLSALRHAHELPVPRGALALGESLADMKERLALVGSDGPHARHTGLGMLVALMLVAFLALPSRAVPSADQTAAKAAAQVVAEAWIAIIDDGRYAESWHHADTESQQAMSIESWERACTMARNNFGRCLNRTLAAADHQINPRGPDGVEVRGEAVVLRYDSTYDKVSNARDTVVLFRRPGGPWRPTAYLLTFR